MTEAEVARDLHEVLEKVWQGIEVVIEQDLPVICQRLIRSTAGGFQPGSAPPESAQTAHS